VRWFSQSRLGCRAPSSYPNCRPAPADHHQTCSRTAAGIPSVVYGFFFGLIVLTNWIRISFDIPTGETWLAGSILLGLWRFQTIVSVSEDAINSVPREYKEDPCDRATGWQTINRVIMPPPCQAYRCRESSASAGQSGRQWPSSWSRGMQRSSPNPSGTYYPDPTTDRRHFGIETGEVAIGSLHYKVGYWDRLVLLVITLIINLTATMILGRIRSAQTGGVVKKRLFSHTTGGRNTDSSPLWFYRDNFIPRRGCCRNPPLSACSCCAHLVSVIWKGDHPG